MHQVILGIVLRLVARLAVAELWPVVRAAIVRTMDQDLVAFIEDLVVRAEDGDMSGDQKAEWVRGHVRPLSTSNDLPRFTTPSHLINLAIEYAVAKLRAR